MGKGFDPGRVSECALASCDSMDIGPGGDAISDDIRHH